MPAAGAPAGSDAAQARPLSIPERRPDTLPDRVDGYDRPDFEPALAALLSVLRDGPVREPDAEVLDLIREPMPADLSALLLTLARGNGWFFDVPTDRPAGTWWLESAQLRFPDPADYRIPDLPESGLHHLEADHLLLLGSDPGGHVEIFAAWNHGDDTFRLASWDNEYNESYPVGTVSDLLQQALDKARYDPDCDGEDGDDIDPDDCDFERVLARLDDDVQEWVRRARSLGADLN